MESKDKKKYYTLKEDFERRGINSKSIMNIFKYSINGVKAYAEDGKSFVVYLFCAFIEIILFALLSPLISLPVRLAVAVNIRFSRLLVIIAC